MAEKRAVLPGNGFVCQVQERQFRTIWEKERKIGKIIACILPNIGYNGQKDSEAEVERMKIDTDSIVSVSEANQNFSRVTRIADARGEAVIFKNNRPKYLLIDLEGPPLAGLEEKEKLRRVAERILSEKIPSPVKSGEKRRNER